MAVTYLRFDGERVSDLWYPLLRDARAAGVDFVVNDGQRTFSEQGYLRRLYESNPRVYPLAARPSHTAPHMGASPRCHAAAHGQRRVVAHRMGRWHVPPPPRPLGRNAAGRRPRARRHQAPHAALPQGVLAVPGPEVAQRNAVQVRPVDQARRHRVPEGQGPRPRRDRRSEDSCRARAAQPIRRHQCSSTTSSRGSPLPQRSP
jgi:hypothetical protein